MSVKSRVIMVFALFLLAACSMVEETKVPVSRPRHHHLIRLRSLWWQPKPIWRII